MHPTKNVHVTPASTGDHGAYPAPLLNRNQYPAAFPTFDTAQLQALGPYARPRRYAPGETLFSVGGREFRFYVLKSGRIALIDHSATGDLRTLATHEQAGEFTGDVANLAGNPARTGAVALGVTEVYEMNAEDLRRLLSENPALSNIILSGFIARQRILEDLEHFAGLRVIGSRFHYDTVRIREFLAKNRVLFTWTDTEEDPTTDRLLQRFGLQIEETPVLCWTGAALLRNPSNAALADLLGLRQPVEAKTLYDLVIIGAGPAGLSAAVYAASEGVADPRAGRLGARRSGRPQFKGRDLPWFSDRRKRRRPGRKCRAAGQEVRREVRRARACGRLGIWRARRAGRRATAHRGAGRQ